ncbi:hypothetical protein AB0K18_42700 [Nonomuraea sp. NPDC049421]|uniref:hypothetical protein n=1 Tax=Nonomuraea sp. NPDC049421 TaxID=3155275 RepID=UPI00342C0FBA
MLEGRGPVVDGLHVLAQAYLSGWPWPRSPAPPDAETETYQPGDRVPGWFDETN